MNNTCIESIRLKFNKIQRKIFANKRKKLLLNNKFTIISNNCWGGMIYESYNLPKQSPTVGLFFEADDYIKFIYNLKYYLSKNINFIKYTESKRFKNGNKDNCIVGKIDDIEIYFLHYKDENEVLDKWKRRIKRINYEKILFKFNDQNGCSLKNVKDFLNFPEENKVFFTVHNYNINNKNIIRIKGLKNQKTILASQEPYGNSKYININELINKL